MYLRGDYRGVEVFHLSFLTLDFFFAAFAFFAVRIAFRFCFTLLTLDLRPLTLDLLIFVNRHSAILTLTPNSELFTLQPLTFNL